MRRPFASIRVRLVVWYLGFLAVLLVFLNVFLYLTLQHFLTQDLTTALRARARTLNTALVAVLPGDAPTQRLDAILNVRAVPAVQATLFDSSGNLVASSNGAPEGAPVPDERLLRLALLPEGQEASVHRWEAPWGDSYLYIWQIVRPRRGPPAIAQVSISAERVAATQRQLIAVMLLGDGAALLLAGLVGLPWVGAALAPLRRMVEATRRIAAGDFSQRVNLPLGNDEVGQLARSFNEMSEQLGAAFQAQRRFVADASHELRSPLTALLGSTEVLLMGAASDPKVSHQMLRSMNREIKRLIRLVNELLTLSKIDAELPMRHDALDLSELLTETVEQVRALAEPRQLIAGIPGPCRVAGDADRLKEVFLNIAENAIRHTQPSGRLEIGLQQIDGWAVVQIKDDGEGIAPDALPHIFDRFYSSDRSRAREKSGTGLGLSIAKAIVEAHGGAIDAASEPGAGSLFTVRLPIS